MRTKQVVDRQRSAQRVLSSGQTHGKEIVEGLTALFTPLLRRGEKLPDLALLVELLNRLVERSIARLVESDDSYQRELLDDAAPRQARDDSATELYDRLVELREVLSGLYGSGVLKEAGFSQGTPHDPTQLSRFANQVATALPGVKLPKPRVAGTGIDSKAASSDLGTRRAKLDDALAAVARESREAQAAQSVRNAAQADFDEQLAGVAALLSGFLRLAGKPDLADRVKPSLRRGEKPDEPAPAPAPGSGPGASSDKDKPPADGK